VPPKSPAGFAQAGAHQEAAEAAADDGELHGVADRLAGEPRFDIGVVDIARELGLDLDILADAVLAQALVAL